MDNLKIGPDMLFMAADGDGIGKKVGRAVIANDTDALHKISARIDAAQDFILHWAKQVDGVKISGGGDEFTAAIPKDAVKMVESLRKDIEHAFGYTISVGIGKSLSEAGTALLVAKLRGKDQIVHFTEEVKDDIKKAKRRVREKRATPDEYKLAEAYLGKEKLNKTEEDAKKSAQGEDDCAYCNETDGVDPNHCDLCHNDSEGLATDDCPFCQEEGESCPLCNDAEGSDCEFCKENGAVPDQDTKIQSPDSNNSTAPAGSEEEKAQANEMGMNPPAIGKPEAGNNSSPAGMGDSNPAYDTAGAPIQPPGADPAEQQANDGIPQEGAHSKEHLEAIAQRIENETVEGKPADKEVAKEIDDTDLAGAGCMQDTTSRPENFDTNTPGDMGTDSVEQASGDPSEAGEDLSSVLQEGLNDGADQEQLENVRGMVGQALQGFKASKDILETSKEQSPQLYSASIMMLKAMIEMAKMLGMGQGQAGSTDEWSDPFPKHPDQGGERKPGHAAGPEAAAEAPKGKTPIGQPIGKLSAKHTTKHVARTPLPPGAINAKGQQKVIDPKTGKTRFIDRKKGMVQSPTGVPIKPPTRGEGNEPKN